MIRNAGQVVLSGCQTFSRGAGIWLYIGTGATGFEPATSGVTGREVAVSARFGSCRTMTKKHPNAGERWM